MTWVDGLYKPGDEKKDPLPRALLHFFLGDLSPAIRASALFSARLLQNRQRHGHLVLLIPPAQQGFAQGVVTGVLLAEFVEHGQKGKGLEGNMLLVTHQVTRMVQSLTQFELGGVAVSELWKVCSYTQYQPIETHHPTVVVSNAGWMTLGNPIPADIRVVVIDASHPRTRRLLPEIMKVLSEVPVKILLTSPLDKSTFDFLCPEEHWLRWVWDLQTQTTLARHFNQEVLPEAPAELNALLVCDNDPEFDFALSDLRQELISFMKVHPAAQKLSLHTWRVYHRLRQLCVPLHEYENAAQKSWMGRTLDQEIDQLTEVDLPQAALLAPLHAVKSKARLAYGLLANRKEPVKFYAVWQHLEQLLTSDQSFYVVATQAEIQVLKTMLVTLSETIRRAEETGQIEFITCGEEGRRVSAGEGRKVLLMGHRTSSHKYLDLFPAHQRSIILYPHEAPIEVASQNRLLEQLGELHTPLKRKHVLTALNLAPSCADPEGATSTERVHYHIRNLDGRTIQMAKIHEAAKAINLAELTQISMDALFESGETKENGRRSGGHLEEARCITVTHDDGCVLQLPPDAVLYAYMAAREELHLYRARELHPGLQVVCFVDDAYSDLYDRMTEAFSRHENPIERALLELWQHAKVNLLRQHQNNRSSIHRALLQRGLDVDYSTVRTWFLPAEFADPQQFPVFCAVAQESKAYTDERRIAATFNAIQNNRIRRRKAGRQLHQLLRTIARGEGYREALQSANELDTEIGELFAAVKLRTVTAVQHPLLATETQTR